MERTTPKLNKLLTLNYVIDNAEVGILNSKFHNTMWHFEWMAVQAVQFTRLSILGPK